MSNAVNLHKTRSFIDSRLKTSVSVVVSPDPFSASRVLFAFYSFYDKSISKKAARFKYLKKYK